MKKKADNSNDYFDECKDAAGEIVDQIFGGKSGAENEFTVRKKIAESTWIFRDEKKGRDPDEIKKVEPVLIAAREWMKEHNFPDSENDACWGLYLCYNRTQREDLAVIELQRIRDNIERARSNIAKPIERARLSERYPCLHAAECTLLHKLGRNEELLEAIEASKSRILADLQTIRDGRPADEKQFLRAIEELPSQLKKLDSHYLTTFVDDDAVYCSLLTSDGQIHSSRVELTKETLSTLAAAREPRLWGKRNPHDPFGPRYPEDVPQQLSSIVEWISPLLDSGIIKVGDHVCYSPHDILLAVPFHYIDLNGSPLVESFSLSRIHGAHSLLEILKTKSIIPESYLAVEVPAVQDSDNQLKLKAFEDASKWLRKNMMSGDLLSREKADVTQFALIKLQNRLIHFATHGTFPEQDLPDIDPNPFRSSGLILAAEGRLPDLMRIGKGQDDKHLLTPKKTIQLGLDLTGSHLTLQACVSGLSKRGYGGDALGLEWAFLQLGATSVLSTHWHTSAQTTARFIEHFYDRWLKRGKNRSAAWRDTVLELRKNADTSDPYHWAAFSLLGDWR